MGEVSVDQESLDSFLKTAEDFKVYGLCGESEVQKVVDSESVAVDEVLFDQMSSEQISEDEISPNNEMLKPHHMRTNKTNKVDKLTGKVMNDLSVPDENEIKGSNVNILEKDSRRTVVRKSEPRITDNNPKSNIRTRSLSIKIKPLKVSRLRKGDISTSNSSEKLSIGFDNSISRLGNSKKRKSKVEHNMESVISSVDTTDGTIAEGERVLQKSHQLLDGVASDDDDLVDDDCSMSLINALFSE